MANRGSVVYGEVYPKSSGSDIYGTDIDYMCQVIMVNLSEMLGLEQVLANGAAGYYTKVTRLPAIDPSITSELNTVINDSVTGSYVYASQFNSMIKYVNNLGDRAFYKTVGNVTYACPYAVDGILMYKPLTQSTIIKDTPTSVGNIHEVKTTYPNGTVVIDTTETAKQYPSTINTKETFSRDTMYAPFSSNRQLKNSSEIYPTGSGFLLSDENERYLSSYSIDSNDNLVLTRKIYSLESKELTSDNLFKYTWAISTTTIIVSKDATSSSNSTESLHLPTTVDGNGQNVLINPNLVYPSVYGKYISDESNRFVILIDTDIYGEIVVTTKTYTLAEKVLIYDGVTSGGESDDIGYFKYTWNVSSSTHSTTVSMYNQNISTDPVEEGTVRQCTDLNQNCGNREMLTGWHYKYNDSQVYRCNSTTRTGTGNITTKLNLDDIPYVIPNITIIDSDLLARLCANLRSISAAFDTGSDFFGPNDQCATGCQIRCQYTCQLSCQSCYGGTCHDQNCGGFS